MRKEATVDSGVIPDTDSRVPHAPHAGCVQIINEHHKGGGVTKADGGVDGNGSAADSVQETERLMPRTEDLPIYTLAEVNDKVKSP